jgi:large-conductance mechanosensitive channel
MSYAFAEETDTETTTVPPLKSTPETYPYGKRHESSGVRLSEYQALSIPSFVLVIILIVFLAFVGFVIYKIFDSQAEKERKRLEKQKLKEEKKNKGSTKGSRKSD